MSRSAVLSILATVLALLASSIITAGAADFQCTASAAGSPVIRAEGRAELVSDLVLICTGGVFGNLITPDIAVFLNTNITSNILIGDITEVLLLIDAFDLLLEGGGKCLAKSDREFSRVVRDARCERLVKISAFHCEEHPGLGIGHRL